MNYRAIAVVIALLGMLAAAYVEFGTTRAADVERSFAWFAFEAAPFVLLAVLALASPYVRTLGVVGLAMLALEAYAYYVVFVLPPIDDAALIYLRKPFYGLGILAVGMLAGFMISRSREPR
jgi:hypothetical protein